MTKSIGERRAEAAQACRDRFVGKTYDPRHNRDCIKLAGHAAHKMGRRVSLTKGLRYSTEAGGLKAMKKLGFKSLLDAVDAALPDSRIPPAMARPGDIIALKADDAGAFGCALTVAFDNGRVIGFVNGIGAVCRIDDPSAFITAWSIVPRPQAQFYDALIQSED
ncbi:hypothetical protein [uncultured Brevundimonas sp.]|uniref:DUF6950 family protein n=1 Tax=uncultured Brevundimonas sp. TaxID=213418 RepID=UPI0025CE0463|nr:hypothetical protein [uncultured Brevundimonas sp.]